MTGVVPERLGLRLPVLEEARRQRLVDEVETRLELLLRVTDLLLEAGDDRTR